MLPIKVNVNCCSGKGFSALSFANATLKKAQYPTVRNKHQCFHRVVVVFGADCGNRGVPHGSLSSV